MHNDFRSYIIKNYKFYQRKKIVNWTFYVKIVFQAVIPNLNSLKKIVYKINLTYETWRVDGNIYLYFMCGVYIIRYIGEIKCSSD